MSSRTEYLLQADQCKKFADTTKSLEHKARWLELSGKWLKLAEQVASEGEGFTPVVYQGGVSRP